MADNREPDNKRPLYVVVFPGGIAFVTAAGLKQTVVELGSREMLPKSTVELLLVVLDLEDS